MWEIIELIYYCNIWWDGEYLSDELRSISQSAFEPIFDSMLEIIIDLSCETFRLKNRI